jgi:hypothetical protein
MKITTVTRGAGVYFSHTIACLSALGLILGVFSAVFYALSVHHRREAEHLLRQIAALRPGVTDLRTVKRIAREAGGEEHCAGDLCSYDFEYHFALTNSGLGVFRRTEWDYFGLRPWRINARIETKGSELTATDFGLLVGRGRGSLVHEGLFSGRMWSWLLISVTAESGRFQSQLGLEKETRREYAISGQRYSEAGGNGVIVTKPNLDTPGGGEALDVFLSPNAPPESRKAAFDLNLSCATKMQPCTVPCQLAPSAWPLYVQFIKSNGWAAEEPAECTRTNRR